ncbi:hypothetical protein H072_3539 [Dactylellina haptotyla CBS 200.50]|uniref:non-specific serine/threonine protein kinase n=2 Tax=Dactylellina haptotyla TaxID=430498 RepID=S8C476_DACHA|nr:hypothetical protein [Dactylellina haptotyla]EPS42492.1 hypothetical protein H072_3539 [Dactylellina haptotyla CBS 200.50]
MASTPTRDYGSSDLAPGSWIILKSMVYARTLINRDKVMGENNVYQHIHGLGIGPDFLGHVIEEDRTTGFLLKYIQNFRIAESRDLDLCRKVLSKLHALGIVHGNISKWNFLVDDNDTRVTIVDFGQSKRGLPEDLEAEMKLLPVKLQETYPRTTDLDDQPIWESDPFTLHGNPVFSEEFKEPSDLA